MQQEQKGRDPNRYSGKSAEKAESAETTESAAVPGR